MATHTTRMTVSDIAEMAGVQRATVSNWQRRHDEFPKPLSDSAPGRPQFDAAAVRSWLAERYPEKLASDNLAADVVRNWRYTVNDVQCDDSNGPLTLLIAAIQGERISYDEGGYDERYPMCISANDLDTHIYATKSQADAIKGFLETELTADGVDQAELVERAARDFDDLGRWRRSTEAVSAEQNLHNLIARLVHEESKSVLDFACGTGALLAAVSREHPGARLVGMEPDFIEAFIADARLARRADAEIGIDKDILKIDALAGRTFDAVVSIPPYGRKVDPLISERMRRLPFGPVRGSADAAWPQLAVQALAPNGEAFLVLPHSVAFEDRSDHIRRELVQRGLIAAVVTLPSNAHPSSKVMSDLWILSRRREPTTDVLFVDYSAVDPSDSETYSELAHMVCNWLDDPSDSSLIPDEPHFVTVAPIKLLGQAVTLDPLYWCARVATPTSATELIEVVEQARATLVDAREAAIAEEILDYSLFPDQPVMLTVRDARDEGMIDILRRTVASKSRRAAPGDRPERPILGLAHAEAMWRGDDPVSDLDSSVNNDPFAYHEIVRRGDVLVWATSDRQVRSTVSTVGGYVPSSSLTVLRCGSELDADYLALALATGRNAIHTTGSNMPVLRGLELSFPLVPLQQQRRIADYAKSASSLLLAANNVVVAAAAFRQALADAAGSGSVGIAPESRRS